MSLPTGLGWVAEWTVGVAVDSRVDGDVWLWLSRLGGSSAVSPVVSAEVGRSAKGITTGRAVGVAVDSRVNSDIWLWLSVLENGRMVSPVVLNELGRG